MIGATAAASWPNNHKANPAARGTSDLETQEYSTRLGRNGEVRSAIREYREGKRWRLSDGRDAYRDL
jgi:hypothetical protein